MSNSQSDLNTLATYLTLSADLEAEEEVHSLNQSLDYNNQLLASMHDIYNNASRQADFDAFNIMEGADNLPHKENIIYNNNNIVNDNSNNNNNTYDQQTNASSRKRKVNDASSTSQVQFAENADRKRNKSDQHYLRDKRRTARKFYTERHQLYHGQNQSNVESFAKGHARGLLYSLSDQVPGNLTESLLGIYDTVTRDIIDVERLSFPCSGSILGEIVKTTADISVIQTFRRRYAIYLNDLCTAFLQPHESSSSIDATQRHYELLLAVRASLIPTLDALPFATHKDITSYSQLLELQRLPQPLQDCIATMVLTSTQPVETNWFASLFAKALFLQDFNRALGVTAVDVTFAETVVLTTIQHIQHLHQERYAQRDAEYGSTFWLLHAEFSCIPGFAQSTFTQMEATLGMTAQTCFTGKPAWYRKDISELEAALFQQLEDNELYMWPHFCTVIFTPMDELADLPDDIDICLARQLWSIIRRESLSVQNRTRQRVPRDVMKSEEKRFRTLVRRCLQQLYLLAFLARLLTKQQLHDAGTEIVTNDVYDQLFQDRMQLTCSYIANIILSFK